ncbi:MAG: hypothetical protein QOF01_83 [Thermomicrobiales bacterium]|nr:hypothetical protein [Thermomicrobiales bacterium]
MAGALAGITVIELDAGTAGAIAGMLFADNGARVVKVEPNDGSVDRALPGHNAWNRGKESVVAGHDDAALDRLVDLADVVILSRCAAGRAAVVPPDWDPIVGRPQLIVCEIGGFATTGAPGTWPVSDALVAARAGLCGNQPGWARGPSYLAFPLPSLGAALLSVQGITAALFARATTGRGRRVETSLLAGTLAMSARVVGDGIAGERVWNWRANGPFPFYSAYACADGRWLQFGCIHDGFAKRAAEVLGIADALPDGDTRLSLVIPPPEAQDRIHDLIAEAVVRRPLAEWAPLLEAADVPFAPVQTAEQYRDDPQALVNGLVTVSNPGAHTVRQPGPAVRLSDTSGYVRAGAPRLGEHSADLAREIATHAGRRPDAPANGDAPRGRQALGGPDSPLPLTGVRVLELANLIAGPMAGRLLADLGAEVIKLEPPDGGDIARRNGSPAFLPLNCGKRGIAVNLRTEAGREIGHRLARWADVVIDNMRPGVAERLGMGWEDLHRLNPRLVYCHVSAFGSRGPYAHKPGLDPLAAALAGMATTQGGAGQPVYVQGAVVDHTAALLASVGVLLSLHARARTGRGQKVETSLLDAAAFVNAPAIGRPVGERAPLAPAASQFGPSALERIYETADGWLLIDAGAGDAWVNLARAVGEPRLDENPEFASGDLRRRHDAALAAELAARFCRRPTADWLAVLDAAGVPVQPVRDGADRVVLADPLLAEAGFVAELVHPVYGRIVIPSGWLRAADTPHAPPTPSPLLGQHTAEVLAELGFSRDTVCAWGASGVVGIWEHV